MKFDLLGLWKRIKKDAAELRGKDEKPGGGFQGFEKALTAMQDKLKKDDIDLPEVGRLATALAAKFRVYGGGLSREEKVLADGCQQMARMLDGIEGAAELAIKRMRGLDKKRRDHHIYYQQLSDLIYDCVSEIKKLHADATELSGQIWDAMKVRDEREVDGLKDKVAKVYKWLGVLQNRLKDISVKHNKYGAEWEAVRKQAEKEDQAGL